MKEGQCQRIRDNTGSNRGREIRQQVRLRGSTEGALEGAEAIWMARTDSDTSDWQVRSQNTTDGQSTLHKEKGEGERRERLKRKRKGERERGRKKECVVNCGGGQGTLGV